MVLHAGDICNLGTEPGREVSDWLDRSGAMVVRGNHDTVDNLKGTRFRESFRSREVVVEKAGEDLYVVGMGWSGEEYFYLPTEDDLLEEMNKSIRMAVSTVPNGAYTVLLSHYPPKALSKDIAYAGWFYRAVDVAMMSFAPIALVCGHAHSLFGETKEFEGQGFKTLMVNPGPHGGILTIDTDVPSARFEENPIDLRLLS